MAQFDRRRTLKLLASLGAAGSAAPLLSACTDSDDGAPTAEVNKGPIKIGLLVPQSGGFKAIGEDVQHGFELYLELNKKKLGGYTPELVVAHEGDDEAQAKAAAEKLIRTDRVAALSGVVNSTAMLGMKQSIEDAQVPLVGSNASPKGLDGTKYIWRTSYSNLDPGGALGAYVLRQQNGSGSAFMMAPNNPAGIDEVQGFRDAYTRTGQGKIEATFMTEGANFGAALAAIKAATKPGTAVYVFYAGALAVEFVREWNNVRPGKKLYAAGFLTEGAGLLRDLGPGAEKERIQTSMNYSADLDNLANRRFASEYFKAYNTLPTTYAMASYDAALVLDKALSLIEGDPNPQGINSAIGKVGLIDSPRGLWQFNLNRTPLQKWYLREVRYDGTTLTNSLISELTTLPTVGNS